MPNICPWIRHSQHARAVHILFSATVPLSDQPYFAQIEECYFLIGWSVAICHFLISSPGAGQTPIPAQTSCFTFHCVYSGVAWWALHIRCSWLRNTRCGSREWEKIQMYASHPHCVRLESLVFNDLLENSFIPVFLGMTEQTLLPLVLLKQQLFEASISIVIELWPTAKPTP